MLIMIYVPAVASTAVTNDGVADDSMPQITAQLMHKIVTKYRQHLLPRIYILIFQFQSRTDK